MERTRMYLNGYNITDLSIRLNPNFKPTNELISVNPIFKRSITKIDENTAIVVLSVEIQDDGNKPFLGRIIIQGTFRCENWENDSDGIFLINETSTSILFPYLRHALSEATTLLNIPTFTLPVVNTVSLFKNKRND